MCGFVGYKIFEKKQDDSKILKSMADTIIHRGPDSEGYYIDDDIALGFRRLSIIDLDGGSQPMCNEDSSAVITFNGEIYNYRELRAELIAKGHVFKTNSDTETILHGYEEYGKGILDKLRGMYAFVIWNKKTQTLFGARDIFGIKPFYYYKTDKAFMFGSEIKSFLPNPDFKKDFRAELLPDYLCFEYIPNENTFFRDVYKLLGGHCFEYKDGRLKIEKYYDIKYNIDRTKSLDYWKNKIIEVFRESVEAHRISDVEVGCFLSSGVDSSFVAKEVSSRAAVNPNTNIEEPVKTFSIGYEGNALSELDDAAEFARAVNLPNIQRKMSGDMFFEDQAKIQYILDEPLCNPSEVPLYYLAEDASRYLKVVLSGEGADELFGGYPLYQAEAQLSKYEKVPSVLRRAASKALSHAPNFKGKHFIVSGGQPVWKRYARCNYVFTAKDRNTVLKNKVTGGDPALLTKGVFDKVSGLDSESQCQYADIHVWMAFDILQKADRMSMAHSLELRVPFLDKKVLELAMQIPPEYRAGADFTKLALREAAATEIPERSAKMKKKGFPVPLDALLREDKYYNLIKEKFAGDVAAKFFDTDAVIKLLDDHKNGVHNMKKVWMIYTFILWYEEFFVKR